MIVSVVLPESKLEKVKQCLSNQKSAGIKFEYFTETNEVFVLIKERGFYMDKLVIISSVLADFNEAARQILIDNLSNVCETFIADSTKEILMIDSGKLFEMEYHRFFDPYPQFVYQTQKIHPTQLFSLIAGNFIEEENPNIDNDVAKPSFFSKVFGRRKQEIAEPENHLEEIDNTASQNENQKDYSDAPLFTESRDQDTMQSEQEQHEYRLDEDDWDFDLSEPALRNPESDKEYSDSPLFEEEYKNFESNDECTEAVSHFENVTPSEQAEPKENISERTITQQPKKHIVDKPRHISKDVSKTEIKKVKNKSYVDFFQKRSKIILFTGDRRSGTSTVVSNLAEQASRDGLEVLLVDLDFERRGQAVNFPITCDESDVKTILSLYHAIKNSENIADYAIHLNDNLDYLGTSLAAENTEFMNEHVTDDSLRSLLSIAISDYDLVLIDCPFQKIKTLSCLIGLSNYIVHSIQTDTRSVINAINMLTIDDFNNKTDYSIYMSKLMLLLNVFKTHFWNSTEINESTILRYMINLTDDDMYSSLSVLGRIPDFFDYDEYMNNGNLLVMNKKYQSVFIGLLNDLAAKG